MLLNMLTRVPWSPPPNWGGLPLSNRDETNPVYGANDTVSLSSLLMYEGVEPGFSSRVSVAPRIGPRTPARSNTKKLRCSALLWKPVRKLPLLVPENPLYIPLLATLPRDTADSVIESAAATETDATKKPVASSGRCLALAG